VQRKGSCLLPAAICAAQTLEKQILFLWCAALGVRLGRMAGETDQYANMLPQILEKLVDALRLSASAFSRLLLLVLSVALQQMAG
jgi:hypothetical protein